MPPFESMEGHRKQQRQLHMTTGECAERLRPASNEAMSSPFELTPSVSVILREIPPEILPDEVLHQIPKRCHVIGQLLSPYVGGEYGTRYGATAYRKRRGDLSIIPFGSNSRMRLFAPATFFMVFIETSFIESLLAEDAGVFAGADVPITVGIRDAASAAMLSLLWKEAKEGAPTGRLYSDSLLNALSLRLAAINKLSRRANSRRQQSALPGPQLRRVKDMIESHLHENLSLARIARVVDYSPSNFQRVFRAATGQTAHQYVLETRVLKARELLQRRSLSLAEVAAECGFSSQSHMTDVFRSRLGITPASFRRRTLGKLC
jgi:AraC family transcriptional regulator